MLDNVAFVPARAGSKRIRLKNVRPLGGHPLLAYAVTAAIDSRMFDRVVCSTDSLVIAQIAKHYGAEPLIRPASMATSSSPDIEWVRHALQAHHCETFNIVRPTSPFRRAETIRRAMIAWKSSNGYDSLRAVERVTQHPMKMWVVRFGTLHPLIPFGPEQQPWHSSQTATLPDIFVQNAALEIAWTKTVGQMGTIAGERIMPFFTSEEEGFDINYPRDWTEAEGMVDLLPEINREPWAFDKKGIEQLAGDAQIDLEAEGVEWYA